MAKAKKKIRREENFPKVSVILTSYNHAAYVAAAIESTLNQTFTDFELLIVDDGSTDNSREIIKTFSDARIKFFLYEKNRGPAVAVRDAVSSARGEYIAVHHSDDLWTPDKLARQVEFLDANKNFAACFTWVDFVDEAGNVRELEDGDFYKNVFDQSNRSRADWLNYFFYNANCLCHPSAMVRRDAYEKFHLTEVHGFWQLPDYLMWVRLCFHAEIFILPERLTLFRLRRERQENTSATTSDRLIRADLEFLFVAQEFIYNFTDNKFFLEVFPEAEKFLVNGKINRRFAFAQLCLQKKNFAVAAFQMTGLTILKNLLNSPENAAQIWELYGYDDKSFLRDGGGFDVFNLGQKLNMLHAEIFVGDEDFEFATDKLISVDANGKFYGRIDVELRRLVKYLRFDPDSRFISVKINRVLINGEPREIFANNAKEIIDGFYRFWTNDPQFIFKCEMSGRVTLEIFGERDENFSENLMQVVKNFIDEKNSLAAQNQSLIEQNKNITLHNENLRRLNTELTERNDELQQRNTKLHSWNDEMRQQCDEVQRQYAELQRHCAELQQQLDAANLHNANLHAENQRLAQFNAELLNSNSWRMTEPLRAFRRWINYDGRDKVLAAGRLFYKALPFSDDTKTELKDKFYTRFGSLLEGTELYKRWQMSNTHPTLAPKTITPPAEGNFFAKEMHEQPGKIAIQAHIFYLDLLDEMAAHCANMPYKFDALISIVDESAADKVRKAFEKIPNAEKVIVRVVPNRGRDVAPFLAGFGDLLPNYDFVAHIHSKKSLYTGSEQQNWRNYLFDALLGSDTLIRKIFFAFVDDDSVGVIYPRPADNVPYAAFTWMSNRAVGHSLLRSAGIAPNRTEYFDFPAGTMFWARTRALRKFFALGLTFEDFPPEQGQNDGTIAHAFERSILLAAQSEGMNYLEFEPTTCAYSVNFGSKNLWQYLDTRNGTEPELEWLLNQGEIVTFDIFDTLIMRRVAVPALVNEVIRFHVEDLLGCKFDFPKLRLKAEELARQKKFSDVTFDDIYQNFAELTNLDADTCQKIRELEISTEVKLVVPREDVVAWFKEILRRGRQVWLISDMYMQTPDLERLLKKCGITGYEKLLISCETGLRKDTAAIWNNLVAQGVNLVHAGDNETSDVQLPGDRKFGMYHLMSAINLFSQVPFGRAVLEHFGGKFSLYAGICLGVVLSKEFQSPFRLKSALTDGTHRLILHNFHELGYWFYGAPLLTFMLWLIKKSCADGVERILFLARDGYFLRPLYELVAKLLGVEPLPNDYFYASRRAVTVAAIREISQAKELIKLRFEGTTKDFFRARFGLDLGDDKKIILPNEFSLTDCESVVEKIIDEHAEEILHHAAAERKNFEAYIANVGGSLERVGVVDMGYSGTIQFYLQELTEKIFTGYYFATCATNRFGAAASERMRGCFTENDDYGKTNSAVYRYQLLFETILTAPDAQLKNFDANGKPVFGKPEPGQRHFAEINAIHEGIKDFCRDVAETFGDILLRVPLDINFVDVWIRAFMNDDKIVAPELREIFMLDDDYCNTFHGNAFEFYQRGLDRPK